MPALRFNEAMAVPSRICGDQQRMSHLLSTLAINTDIFCQEIRKLLSFCAKRRMFIISKC
jgi:hypothetical protein